jgi:hypothetical protein
MFLQQYAVNLFLEDYCLLGCNAMQSGKATEVSGKPSASIFWVYKASIPKNEAAGSSQTAVPSHQTEQCQIQEDSNPQIQSCENLNCAPSFVVSTVLITNIYRPPQWNNEFSQLLVGRDKVSCFHSFYTFQHSVWAGIVGVGVATKTKRKWLMLSERK